MTARERETERRLPFLQMTNNGVINRYLDSAEHHTSGRLFPDCLYLQRCCEHLSGCGRGHSCRMEKRREERVRREKVEI